ncbi:MAG: hypothetical protein P8N76_16550 [Pirellulaceae bacterium]|nr:hypothetical protein [Pirellulaceae bacterium]
MLFTDEEIEIAKRLHLKKMEWLPAAGHYIYDQTGFCQTESPFQEMVFYILNYKYFMKRVGGVDRFREIMVWLPTWFDLRGRLKAMGVKDETIADYLSDNRAIERGIERLLLYRYLGKLHDVSVETA